jgi:hypothetical protein
MSEIRMIDAGIELPFGSLASAMTIVVALVP